MKAPPFAFVRAESAEHAVSLLTEYGEDAKLLAGGQSLVPMLNLRLTRPSVLVDIGRIPGLSEVAAAGDAIEIGALTTHHDMEQLDVGDLPGLRSLRDVAGLIGHYPIRVRGTVGGSLAHADSASEWALMALVTDAALLVRGPVQSRELPAATFFQGFFTTALEPEEMITSVRFGRSRARTRIEEFARRRGDFAIVAAATSVVLEGGRCTSARIALGGVAGMPIRLETAEQVLTGAETGDPQSLDWLIREVAYVCSSEISPGSDTHASATYRRRLTQTLVERSLRRSLDDHLPAGAAAA